MDKLSSIIDAFNKKLISEKTLAQELEMDIMRIEKNQQVQNAKVCGRIVDAEINKSNNLYSFSPEELLINKECYKSIIDFLLFVKSIIGSIPFQILLEFVVFKVTQKELAEKYHYSRGGIASSIYWSRLKVSKALELYPSKLVLLEDCYTSLTYFSFGFSNFKSAKIGFTFENLKAVCVDSFLRINKKTGKRKYVYKTKCMIPEYINSPNTVCTLCKDCTRKDKNRV